MSSKIKLDDLEDGLVEDVMREAGHQGGEEEGQEGGGGGRFFWRRCQRTNEFKILPGRSTVDPTVMKLSSDNMYFIYYIC